MYLSKKELSTIVGGAITGSMLTAIAGLVTTIFEIGKTVGSRLKALFG